MACDNEVLFINLYALHSVKNINIFNLYAWTLKQFIKEHAHFQSKKWLVILNVQDIE